MISMSIILTLLAIANLTVAYLYVCQKALEKSLAPTRAIWPAIVPVTRPAQKIAHAPMPSNRAKIVPVSAPAAPKAEAAPKAKAAPKAAAKPKTAAKPRAKTVKS